MNRPKGRQVLDCASPLALFDPVWKRKSGRGLPQTKTLSRRRTQLRGSGSQRVRKNERRLFMNQRTPSPRPSPPLGERVSEGRVRGSQCMRKNKRGLPVSPPEFEPQKIQRAMGENPEQRQI